MSPADTDSLGDLLNLLQPFNPLVAGTFPLGVQVNGSDLDILCEVADVDSFEAFVAAHPDWFDGVPCRRMEDVQPHACVVNLHISGLPVEIFAQPVPVHEQAAFRHMVVEARLLAAGGKRLAERVRELKAKGVKTEPAFAQIFRFAGDPYRAVLEVEDDVAAALVQNMASD